MILRVNHGEPIEEGDLFCRKSDSANHKGEKPEYVVAGGHADPSIVRVIEMRYLDIDINDLQLYIDTEEGRRKLSPDKDDTEGILTQEMFDNWLEVAKNWKPIKA